MTNVLLNQTQRDREAAVARTMTDMIVTNCKSTTDIVPQTVLAHHFGLACAESNFIADESSARRILHLVAGELSARKRVADRLNDFLLKSTEDLLEMQRAAKRTRA
jgi:hypothetical protein